MPSTDTQFKKGVKRPKNQEEKRLRNCKLANTGKNSYLWKGDKVGYKCLHDWVRKWKETLDICEVCGNDKLRHRQYQWANIDHKYRRVLEDYIRMCAKCHRNYDYENHLCNIGSRGGSIKNKKI